MKEQLELLYANKITFNQFVRATANDWNRLATYIYNAWRAKLPVGVDVEDVRQEMLAAAWIVVGNYDESRGVKLKSYVIFNVCARALRWIHEQRNAKRRSDKAQSRFPTSFTAMHNRDVDANEAERVANLLEDTVSLQADELFYVAEAFSQAMNQSSGVETYAFVALKRARGDFMVAGNELFSETDISLRMRWSSPRDAAEYIGCAIAQNMKEVMQDGKTDYL